MLFKTKLPMKRERDSDRYLQTTEMAKLSEVIARMEYEAKYRKEKSDAS